MRNKIIITILLFLTSVAVAIACPGEGTVTQQNTASTSSNNQWIEVGEVTLFTYADYDCIENKSYKRYLWIRHQGILYAYYIGERMLYKVDIKDKMYTVGRFSSTEIGYGDKYNEFNGMVTINGGHWFLTVPSW